MEFEESATSKILVVLEVLVPPCSLEPTTRFAVRGWFNHLKLVVFGGWKLSEGGWKNGIEPEVDFFENRAVLCLRSAQAS